MYVKYFKESIVMHLKNPQILLYIHGSYLADSGLYWNHII